jgi:tRNA(Arg) A34 adenosine deaminase TadA
MIWETLAEPWRACLEEAWAARCAGSVPIGAAVTDADGHIVARGRNRSGEARADAACLYGHPLAHAEVNALAALDYRAHDPPHSCVLYATTEPCPLCFGALYMSGVRELRFASRDPYAGSSNLLGTTPYLSRKPVRVRPPSLPDLEEVIVALFAEWHFTGRGDPENVVLAAYRTMLPEAVRLGERLSRDGELLRLRDGGASTPAMLAGLEVVREELRKENENEKE